MTEQKKTNDQNKALFVNLVMMFASSAMQQMGKLVNPLTNKIEVDMEAAQVSIDMLGMLEEKTKGKLDPDEQRLLTNTLASLRMNYVDTAQSAPASGAEPKQETAAADKSSFGESASSDQPGTDPKDKGKHEPKYHKSYG